VAIPVKNLLHSFFKQESWKVKLLSEWESIVGNLASKMILEKIESTSLVIGVYESCWLQELYLLSSVLINTINKHLDKPRIQNIRFIHATPKQIIKKKNDEPKILTKQPPLCLSHREEEALSKIKDKQLKEALHKFLGRCHYEKIKK